MVLCVCVSKRAERNATETTAETKKKQREKRFCSVLINRYEGERYNVREEEGGCCIRF